MSESRLEGYRKGGFRTGEIQNGRDTTVLQTGGIKDCWEAGQVVYRTGGNQNWRDSRLEVFKLEEFNTGGIQSLLSCIPPVLNPSCPIPSVTQSLIRESELEGFKTGGTQYWRDSIPPFMHPSSPASLQLCIPPVMHPSSSTSQLSCILQSSISPFINPSCIEHFFHVSILSCIPLVLNPFSSESLLSFIPPVLNLSAPESLLFFIAPSLHPFIPQSLHPSFPTSLLSCILPVLYPSCPATILFLHPSCPAFVLFLHPWWVKEENGPHSIVFIFERYNYYILRIF